MIAKVHIQTNCDKDITRLGHTYFTPPFKVANITEDKKSRWLQLMIMNSSPGVLDGDDYDIKIELNEGSCLQLHTQSYQRLFTMKTKAVQTTSIHLQDNCSFTYLPHPSVPHENSSFTSKTKIHLNDNCNLIWGEVLTCGRKLNGEVFQFSSYHSLTEIYQNNRLIIRENLLMQPSLVDPGLIGQLEGYTHQATLILTQPNDLIYDYLSQQDDILFGVTSTVNNGMLVRILGNGAEHLYNILLSTTDICKLSYKY